MKRGGPSVSRHDPGNTIVVSLQTSEVHRVFAELLHTHGNRVRSIGQASAGILEGKVKAWSRTKRDLFSQPGCSVRGLHLCAILQGPDTRLVRRQGNAHARAPERGRPHRTPRSHVVTRRSGNGLCPGAVRLCLPVCPGRALGEHLIGGLRNAQAGLLCQGGS